MITPALHQKPVALDSGPHRNVTVQVPVTDWSPAAKLNAIFVCAAEFNEACHEYPLVFIEAGKGEDGKDEVAPIAVLGVAPEQNLYLQPNGSWRANYMPAVLRNYPFAIARIDAQRYAICVDEAYAGLNKDGGQRLFTQSGERSELLNEVSAQCEAIEQEVARTRWACQQLQQLALLRPMRFDAKLPDGRSHVVEGFLTVDEEKLKDLPDATVGELHRNGLMGLIHRHWSSMTHMQRLVQLNFERIAAATH